LPGLAAAAALDSTAASAGMTSPVEGGATAFIACSKIQCHKTKLSDSEFQVLGQLLVIGSK
jgi:hypothetical protein